MFIITHVATFRNQKHYEREAGPSKPYYTKISFTSYNDARQKHPILTKK